MIFLADENFPRRAAYMLDQFDSKHEVRAFLDYFEKGTRDTDWMPVVASWNGDPVTIGGDGRILRNKVEKQMLKDCGLMFVLLAPRWTHLKWEEFAYKIVQTWPKIIRNVEQARYPMLFEVSCTGKVRGLGRISSL